MKNYPIEKIRAMVGRRIGISDWFEIDQDRINTFAECTEDRQWIHLDAVRAASSPFGKTLAHGFLTLSLIPYLCRDISVIPERTRARMNYGLNSVRLISPVPVGSKIRDILVLKEVKEKDRDHILITSTHTIEIQGEEKPACVAELISLYIMGSPNDSGKTDRALL